MTDRPDTSLKPRCSTPAGTTGCTVEPVADKHCRTGEGPLWHPEQARVYWSDIPAGRLYRFNPQTGHTQTVYADRPVGGYTLQADGSLLLFRDRGNVVRWREGAEVETIIDQVPELLETRFNDVCADPEGRVFCGTMSTPSQSGRLYRLNRDGTLTLLREGYGTPNGMGFSPDRQWLYFNDSRQAQTWRFAYQAADGGLSAPILLRDAAAQADPGRPDGLAVDAGNGIWTGRWDGGCLLRLDPHTLEVTDRIDLPARNVTSLCFAGDGLRDIYATTAGGQERERAGPGAGKLFRIRGAGFAGLPRFRSRI